MYSMVAPARGTLYFYLLCTIIRASVSMQCANINRIPVQ